MNRSLIVVITYTAFVFYRFVILNILKNNGFDISVLLSFLYILNILFPLFYTLNKAVSTNFYANEGCKLKLANLKINVELLMSQSSVSEADRMDYRAFLENLEKVKELNNLYEIPKFKFMGAIELTQSVKNTLISALSGIFGSVAIFVFKSIK
jgi:VIT1/CCC1 family predicted Fe2+/Mn2+ transporter